MSEARQRNNKDSLPQSDWKEIEAVCDRFEQAWDAGDKPKLEDFLVNDWPTLKQKALLRDLLIVELDKRHAAGEPTSAEEYHKRFPKFRSAVDQAFAAHDEWQTMGSSPGANDATLAPAQTPTIFCPRCKNAVESADHSGSEIKCNTCGESFSLTAASEDTVTHTPPSPGQSAASTSLGDYEVFDEIARGGMGVVYKARHKKLNRTVALKMIHSGQLGSPEHRARFQLEAEAAAKLDHPGITPVYEIGEEHGQPFFAMKLIEGGSLDDRLDEYVGDSEKAARLVADIAHAVHHAHQRGTLHRDLKPNNILIDNDGKPLVTDFGLAKFSDQDSGVTQTGAIMGTPGYMPPEQAAGGKNVTTAADIYSLGAILFATLTGRPPFQGNTPMETVMQVVQKDAPKPSSINSKVPLELELISLKCLSRDPDQRYSSAEELAKDLENWLAGEPVSVRPPSAARLMWTWFRRNAGRVAAAAAIGGLLGPFLLLASQLALYFLRHTFLLREQRMLLVAAAFPIVPYAVGAATVWLTKPRSWNEAVSLGLVTGVFGAIPIFLSVGFVAVVQTSHNHEKVYRQLAQASLVADTGGRSINKARLMWMHPEVEAHDNPKTHLEDESFAELSASMLKVVLVISFGSVAYAGLSLLSAVIFFGQRLSHDRRWIRTLRFIEVSLPIFMAVVPLCFLGFVGYSAFYWFPVRFLVYPVFCIAVAAVWAVVAWRPGRCFLRVTCAIVSFATAFCFATFGMSLSVSVSEDLAPETSLKFAKALERIAPWRGDQIDTLNSATLAYALAKRVEDHQRTCHRILESIEENQCDYWLAEKDSTTAAVLSRSLEACLAISDFSRSETTSRVHQFVTTCLDSDVASSRLFEYPLALYEYRHASSEAARELISHLLESCQDSEEGVSQSVDVLKSFLLQSMIFFEEGQHDRALQSYRRGNNLSESYLQSIESAPDRADENRFYDAASVLHIRAEATELLRDGDDSDEWESRYSARHSKN